VRHVGYKLPNAFRPKRGEIRHSRRIIVSVGTMVQPPESLLVCIADSIAMLPDDVSVLWSVRGLDDDLLDLLRQRLSSRKVRMMPWIQQSDELCDESTSVFISHAGFNSIAE
jgi:hypothetical protein